MAKFDKLTVDGWGKEFPVPYTAEEVDAYLPHVADSPMWAALDVCRDAWTPEMKPNLTIRCAEVRPKKGRCAAQMAQVFIIDGLHYCRYHLRPFVDATLRHVANAHGATAHGAVGTAARWLDGADVPLTGDEVLEYALPAMDFGLLIGCDKSHGDVWINAATLIAEADGPRPTMNVLTTQRFIDHPRHDRVRPSKL